MFKRHRDLPFFKLNLEHQAMTDAQWTQAYWRHFRQLAMRSIAAFVLSCLFVGAIAVARSFKPDMPVVSDGTLAAVVWTGVQQAAPLASVVGLVMWWTFFSNTLSSGMRDVPYRRHTEIVAMAQIDAVATTYVRQVQLQGRALKVVECEAVENRCADRALLQRLAVQAQ